MKKRFCSAMCVMLVAISLSGCFPTEDNNYTTKRMKKDDKVDISTVLQESKHITKKINDNFVVDADIKINIPENFDTYTAVSSECDMEFLQKLYIKNSKIKSKTSDSDEEIYNYEDGSVISKIRNVVKQNLYDYCTGEYWNREYDWLYLGKNDFNGVIDYDREKTMPKKELDFMSSEDACKIVKEKMEKLGIKTDNYEIYSIDYNYIQKKVAEYEKTYSDEDENDSDFSYTKDDELYLIIPQIVLPNKGTLKHMCYAWAVDDFSEIDSAIVYAVVGKKGIIRVFYSGMFNITGENSESDKITSVNNALNNVIESYDGIVIKEPLTLNEIELSYVPIVDNQDKGTFKLRPTWTFSIIKHRTDGTTGRCIKLIDAITGKLINQGNEDTF